MNHTPHIKFIENELQYLDPLPKKLLMQIAKESNLPFAILDIDNVNEFRRNYDDSYYPKYRKTNPDLQQMRMKMKIQMQQKRQMLTGRKKAPPTRPYVHMLMLWVWVEKIRAKFFLNFNFLNILFKFQIRSA